MGRLEVRRRQRQLRSSIGTQLADLREELAVTQVAVAVEAGFDQSHVSRIERGLATPSLDALVALASTLGADVSVRLFPTSQPRLRDHLQAPMIEALVSRLDGRWRAVPELPVPAARGVIDLALRQSDGRLAIACEVHSELRSIERVLRRLADKTAALGILDGTDASSLLIARSTSTTRAIARRFESTLGAAFPGSVAAAVEALTGPTAPWPGPTLLWVRLEGGRAEVLSAPPRGIAVGGG